MLDLLTVSIQIVYAVAAVGLALYGFNTLWLTWKLSDVSRASNRQMPPGAGLSSSILPPSPVDDHAWPRVTVQLPVFNERHVVERLIDACARLDYPADRLQILVLDDSTDQTTAIAQRRAAHWRALGTDIQVVHRTERPGYKAGALAAAMPDTRGDFIAIFDADFLPPPDFLLRAVPHFLGTDRAKVAYVQARWAHLNRGYSVLTQCQALALDGHFAVEQSARQAAGYVFGFNGSAGLWRRTCIEDEAVGGWQADTLCEDLDLSYRAQLAGWQAIYLQDLAAPAEIPPQLLGFKRQQFRWAKGSVQVLLKLSGDLLRRGRERGWSPMTRYQGLFHLGNYLIHPLLLTLLLVSLPLLLLDANPFWPLTYLSLTSLGPPLLYAVGQRRLHPDRWLRHWSYLSLLTFLGVGLSFNNSQAVWQALRGQGGQFLRTPKFRVESAGDAWQSSGYVLALPPALWAELGLMLYALATAGIAMWRGDWWAAPFMLLYAGGFGLMVGLGLWQAWQARPRRRVGLARLHEPSQG